MVENVCEPQKTSDWSQKPAALGSNQRVEIGGVGYSWSDLLKKKKTVEFAVLKKPYVNHASPRRALRRPTCCRHMKLERVTLTVALKASMSMVRQIVYKWKFSFVATAPQLGYPVKINARALSRRSSEDSKKSLAHAHTFVEKSTSKTFKKNGVSRWTPQRKPQRKHCCMFEACVHLHVSQHYCHHWGKNSFPDSFGHFAGKP